MKTARTLLSAMLMALAMVFSVSSAAQNTQKDTDALCDSINKLTADMTKVTSIEEQQKLAKNIDLTLKTYGSSTEKLNAASREKLINAYGGFIKELVNASVRSSGADLSNPALSSMLEQNVQAINNMIKKTANQSETLGQFITTLQSGSM